MKIYGIEYPVIIYAPKPDMRHDWLVRQYEDCKVMTNNALKSRCNNFQSLIG